ncbi:CCA tRNA nucleotidyltransferase [Paenibacillus sp. N4]|uniref:CCA tRNA nucleotidyltransferase n=1 Tax=Paenibacillus vietnamensis TaxID=2590547 RepID=UPI001CD0E74C|nr:CCA tRNA nucleotidyltransferase [Paenibacillus vietnamensis]MCA0754381.1 CCA tRNA nucleotidyltransferase [Paenibacillus vietnamensis]
MKFPLPEPIHAALPIVRRLREHHFEAVFVGGCVRDTVLGLPIKDVDIATSARPEQVLELFDRCIPTGLQHGTITVLLDKTGYEVTTFRLESAYEKHRRPESIQYINSLEEDLLRRDFTINAMALNEEGVLLDPFGGINDLSASVLRCVGDADARFQEDALRMLRAVRFIGTYRLSPVLGTWRALVRYKRLMNFIAMERVQAELDKMLAGKSPQRALHTAAASGLLLHLREPLPAEVTDAVAAAYRNNRNNRNNDTGCLIARLDRLNGTDCRWAAVAIALKLSEHALMQTMKALKLSNTRIKQISDIAAIARDFEIAAALDEAERRKWWIRTVIRYGKQTTTVWLDIMRLAYDTDESKRNGQVDELVRWHEQIPLTSVKQLKVNGSDLKRYFNRKPGPWVSEVLAELLLLAAAGQIENEKQILLLKAAEWDKEGAEHES